jgi:HTH-type transcriptional regulator, competence development regulator
MKKGTKSHSPLFQFIRRKRDINNLDEELIGVSHPLPIWQHSAHGSTFIAHSSTLTLGQRIARLFSVRKSPKHKASEGFIHLLQSGMAQRKISLNQLAERAGVSPAFLSRIINKQRGLPSDEAILRLAKVLDLEPAERLLIEAGRIPEELRPVLSQPRIPELLRAAGKLSEADQQQLLQTVKALALKQRRNKKSI